MTTLTKAKNGDWFARKTIPADLRQSYKAAFGVSQEERFRQPATLPMGDAKMMFRDWDATITSRIESLRAAQTGSKIRLSQRQLRALAGKWYDWFISNHEEDPGKAEDWDSRYEMLVAAYDRFDLSPGGETDFPPAAKRAILAKVIETGHVASFLAEEPVNLDDETKEAFYCLVSSELISAYSLLRRRAGGDYSPDDHRKKFAATNTLTSAVKLSGLNCWEAFEAWVKERKPAASTTNRWRAVFSELNKFFEGRDVTLIDPDEANKWKSTLVTDQRSAAVVNDVWMRAAKTVFNWLVQDRKIPSNPFEKLKVATPRKVKNREREFNEAEWKAILLASLVPPPSRLKPQKSACRRWVPWLCAYTGARAGEMTQLTGSNVFQEDGIWIINISPEDGTVKGASYRKVPIHEHLIEQGFLQFVAQTGDGPLFYDSADKRVSESDPTNPPRPPSVLARGKLAEWVRKEIGITDPDISPNHSWRHTFKRKAARCGMEKRFRSAFCGHESDDVGDIYETPTVMDMAEELRKLGRYEV